MRTFASQLPQQNRDELLKIQRIHKKLQRGKIKGDPMKVTEPSPWKDVQSIPHKTLLQQEFPFPLTGGKYPGGKINRWPIAAGTPQGDKTVQETVTSYVDSLTQDLEAKVSSFGLDTRSDALMNTAAAINSAKVKIEAYANWFVGQREVLLQRIEKANTKLTEKVEELSKESGMKTWN